MYSLLIFPEGKKLAQTEEPKIFPSQCGWLIATKKLQNSQKEQIKSVATVSATGCNNIPNWSGPNYQQD